MGWLGIERDSDSLTRQSSGPHCCYVSVQSILAASFVGAAFGEAFQALGGG